MGDSVFVTSHLVVGGTADKVSGPKAPARTPQQAIDIIDSDATAILPDGAFDLAVQTLVLAGLSQQEAERKVQSAQGGGVFTGFTPVPA